MTANERLKISRESCGLSQVEVAKALGMVSSTLLRWEKGDRLPKESDLKALAVIYQVTPEWILTGEGEPPLRSLRRKDLAKARLMELRSGDPDALTLQGYNYFELRAKKIRRLSGIREELLQSVEARFLIEIAQRIQHVLARKRRLPSLPELSPEVVAAICSGLVVPTPEMLCLLAAGIGVNPWWLLTGEEDMPSNFYERTDSGGKDI